MYMFEKERLRSHIQVALKKITVYTVIAYVCDSRARNILTAGRTLTPFSQPTLGARGPNLIARCAAGVDRAGSARDVAQG